MTHEHWRVGHTSARVLYRGNERVGIMDDAELAVLVVEAVNNSPAVVVELRKLHAQGEKIMGVLEDLQAADTELATEVGDLADEQATFLTDVAGRLANAPDPTAVAAVTADIKAKADALRALADAQRAADPGAPPA